MGTKNTSMTNITKEWTLLWGLLIRKVTINQSSFYSVTFLRVNNPASVNTSSFILSSYSIRISWIILEASQSWHFRWKESKFFKSMDIMWMIKSLELRKITLPTLMKISFRRRWVITLSKQLRSFQSIIRSRLLRFKRWSSIGFWIDLKERDSWNRFLEIKT